MTRTIKFVIAAMALAIAWPTFSHTNHAAAGVSPEKEREIKKAIANLSVPFVKNEGQSDKRVKFYAKTFAGTAFVTEKGEIVYSLPEGDAKTAGREKTVGSEGTAASRSVSEHRNTIIKESLVGAKKIKHIKGEEKSSANISSFIGNDKTKWRPRIPAYNVVNIGEVYQGIEFKLRAHGNNVEKFFYIAPNANPLDIRINLEGAKSLTVNEKGELEAETTLGAVTFTKPIAYQEIAGKKKEVGVEYKVSRNSELQNPQLQYAFKLGAYDKTKELIIDPAIQSTYLGENGDDHAYSIVLDSTGNVYVAGRTSSTNFPSTTGGAQAANGGGSYDTFVSKLNSGLTTLTQSTYIGGSGGDIAAYSIALDSTGNVYVAGYTESTNFPSTTGGAQAAYAGGAYDAFVSKLLPSLQDTTSDTTPPTVPSTGPANSATGVAINSAITATFSETMDAATITTATFTLSDGTNAVTGTVTYLGTTATFTPSANLAYSTSYTATITTGAKDLAGNAIAAYIWSFTTGSAPSDSGGDGDGDGGGGSTSAPTLVALSALYWWGRRSQMYCRASKKCWGCQSKKN